MEMMYFFELLNRDILGNDLIFVEDAGYIYIYIYIAPFFALFVLVFQVGSYGFQYCLNNDQTLNRPTS